MYVACPKGQRKRPSAIRVKAFPGKKKAEKKQAFHYLAANRKRSFTAPLSFV